MAEALGVATAALQVASAGIKISETLYAYINTFRKTEKQLRLIARHVKVTSTILQSLAHVSKNEDLKQSYTPDLLNSANEALNGCSDAFTGLEKFVARLVELDKHGKLAVPATSKLTFYFKQKELDDLQKHIECFQSALELVLGVLDFVSSARNVKTQSEVKLIREILQGKLELAVEAKKQSSTSDPMAAVQGSLVTPDGDFATMSSLVRSMEPASPVTLPSRTSHDQGRAFPPASLAETSSTEKHARGAVQSDRSVGNDSIESAGGSSVQHSLGATEDPDELLFSLEKCQKAVSNLATAIDLAVSRWQIERRYECQCVITPFKEAWKAIAELSACEVCFDVEPPSNRANQAPPECYKPASIRAAPSDTSALGSMRVRKNSKDVPGIQLEPSSPPQKSNEQSQSHDGVEGDDSGAQATHTKATPDVLIDTRVDRKGFESRNRSSSARTWRDSAFHPMVPPSSAGLAGDPQELVETVPGSSNTVAPRWAWSEDWSIEGLRVPIHASSPLPLPRDRIYAMESLRRHSFDMKEIYWGMNTASFILSDFGMHHFLPLEDTALVRGVSAVDKLLKRWTFLDLDALESLPS